MHPFHRFVAQSALAATCFTPAFAQFEVSTSDGTRSIRLESGALARTTPDSIESWRAFRVPDSSAACASWMQIDASGAATEHYAISLDGTSIATVRQTSYELAFRRARFDPRRGEPEFGGSSFVGGGNVHVVQYETQPLREYSLAIERLGGEVFDHVQNHAHIVRMSPAVRARVAALPFVRWVGEYHPEMRVDPEILECLDLVRNQPMRLNVQVYTRGVFEQEIVAERIRASGGTIDALNPEGFRFEATLTPRALLEVASLDQVRFVDSVMEAVSFMDRVRDSSGANTLETVAGFDGSGVNVEVMEATGIQTTHPDFAGRVVLHGTVPAGNHGTCVAGIVGGSGAGNAAARGMLPQAMLVLADGPAFQGGTRYTHTAQLVDPLLPYQCVLQSNSWGFGVTTQYTTISAEMDDIIAQNDIVICQAQGNEFSQTSSTESWAKNVVGVGGIVHNNNANYGDDGWFFASRGPAADGRIKPDLAFYYDRILCTDQTGGAGYVSGNYNSDFDGTSASTPQVAGCFGLFFEMWHAGIFGNAPGTGTVFEARPSSTLARAAVVNTARQWTFSGTNHSLTRMHQGWGHPKVSALHDLRDKTFFVDHTSPVTNLGSAGFTVTVAPGEPAFRATLCFLDAMGPVSSTQHRLNDLTLVVVDPSGTTYYGNHGLETGMWSAAGGVRNTKDVIENVMVEFPMAGEWTVRVDGDDVNTNPVTGGPTNVTDFALWVTGVTGGAPCPEPSPVCQTSPNSVGPGAMIGWFGSYVLARNDFHLITSGCPPNSFGLYFYGQNPTLVPFGNGFRCVGNPLTRLGIIQADPSGNAVWNMNFVGTPVQLGQTWYFQYWYRNPAGGGAGFNLSNALRATFCNG